MTEERFTVTQNGDLFTVRDTVENKPMGVFEFKENEFPVFFCFCGIIRKLNELAEENEQLKKENYELHKRLGDFEPFERYMKERTSKTSLEDIIGIVKTDEPTNSVELKKELSE